MSHSLTTNQAIDSDDNNAPSGVTAANNELSEDITPVDNEATFGQSRARMESKGKPHTQ